MMKKYKVVLLLCLVMMMFAGCTSGQSGQGSSASDSQQSSAAGMRTVETDKGSVEIPESPQVIVSDYYLGEFLAVDVKPVIASPYALNNPFLADRVEGIQAMNTTSAETSLEMIAEAQPDLIVTITEADYEKYAAIAPTVSIVEVWPQEVYTMGSHFARGGSILYDMWDLKAPAKVQQDMVDGDTAYEVVSVEALPEYTGDFILYGVLDGTDPSFVENSDLWQSLDAVQNGQVLSYDQVAFMHRDPITLNAQPDIFLEFFRSHEA